ncbi:hypothetical protein LINPERHAP2_LOCUS15727 [Linum perenne]
MGVAASQTQTSACLQFQCSTSYFLQCPQPSI